MRHAIQMAACPHHPADFCHLRVAAVAVSTTFFFIWNYFINFRTDLRKRDALPRYVAAVAAMWLLQSGILSAFKYFNVHSNVYLGHVPIDLAIVATQFLPSGLKFYLYHKWVFPLPKETAWKLDPPGRESHAEEALANGELPTCPAKAGRWICATIFRSQRSSVRAWRC